MKTILGRLPQSMAEMKGLEILDLRQNRFRDYPSFLAKRKNLDLVLQTPLFGMSLSLRNLMHKER
eukprot:UN00200